MPKTLRSTTGWFALLAFFTVLTVAATYPLARNLSGSIPGFSSTDEPYGVIWHWWWMQHARANGLDPLDCQLIAAPAGIQFPRSIYPLWTSLTNAMVAATGPVAAYSLQIMAGFILAALAMYALARSLLRDRLPAVLAALIYAYCPYHFARAWQHIGLAHTEFMPLYLLALIRLTRRARLRDTLLAAAALCAVAAFDFYYLYFMFLSTAVYAVYLFAARVKNAGTILFKSLIPIVLIAGLYAGAVMLPSMKKIASGYADSPESAWGIKKPYEDLFSQSARPLSYILPPAAHPLFSGLSEPFLGTNLYGESMTEHVLFLGWIPLILAFYAWRKRGEAVLGDAPAEARRHTGLFFFALLALSAWLISQPPFWKIGPLSIPMPSGLLYRFFPMFRAYCRIGIVVMLSTSLWAAAGVQLLLRRKKDRWMKSAIAVFFMALILFEFWTYPPFKVIETAPPAAVYAWLRDQPGDLTIAEYPLDTRSPNEKYKFFQTVHRKKIINGRLPGTAAYQEAQGLSALSKEETPLALARLGVRYILVHRDGYRATGLLEDEEELRLIPGNGALRLRVSFPMEKCADSSIICLREIGAVDVYEIETPKP